MQSTAMARHIVCRKVHSEALTGRATSFLSRDTYSFCIYSKSGHVRYGSALCGTIDKLLLCGESVLHCCITP